MMDVIGIQVNLRRRQRRIKMPLLLTCLLVGCADLMTTNIILAHGGGEANPFMHFAQTWLGPWWLIPKLGLTLIAMWLLKRTDNLRHIIFIIAIMAMPVINNLIIISSFHG
jgi:hypothetical protein